MALATALLLLLLAAPAAYAVQYTVGDSAGWTSAGDYDTWKEGKTFRVGDTLLFTYGGTHSVDEVSENNYDNCNSGSPIKSHTGGNTVITLSNPGSMYFICPTSGHCSQGMKLSIEVAAASGSTPSTPTTPSSPPSTTPSGTPPSGSTPSSPSPSGAPSIMNGGGLIFGFSLMLGAFLAIMS